MSLASQLFKLLNGATQAGSKVYPMAAPDQTLAPFITYQRVNSSSENVLDGSKVNLINTRLQIDIYSTNYMQSAAIFKEVDVLMGQGFSQITSIQNQDAYEAAVDLYRVIAEYSIWHQN